MSTRGRHDGLDRVPPPAQEHGPGGASAGYRPGRTLPFGVELVRQVKRRRTQLTFALLVVLPLVVALAFQLGDPSSGSGTQLVDLASRGAANFTIFTLFVATGFLLVVLVALFAGDTVASEAGWSSLRYLLAAPVPRSRLLRQKLLVALASCAAALVVLPVVTFVIGGLFFGWAPLQTPVGETFTQQQGLWRLAVVVGYLAVSLMFTASLAFALGVLTDAPLGAVGGAVLLVIVSNILDAVTALGSIRDALPTHYSFAWTDVLADPVSYDQMARGAVWSLGYTLVLLAVAWRTFARKDVVS